MLYVAETTSTVYKLPLSFISSWQADKVQYISFSWQTIHKLKIAILLS